MANASHRYQSQLDINLFDQHVASTWSVSLRRSSIASSFAPAFYYRNSIHNSTYGTNQDHLWLEMLV